MDIAYELGLLAGYASSMAVLVTGDSDAFNAASENYWAKRKEIMKEFGRLQNVEVDRNRMLAVIDGDG